MAGVFALRYRTGCYACWPQAEAPDTVHPGLWRQARLNCIHGLFEVVPGIWQARGYDISNISFIAGQRGWVFDNLEIWGKLKQDEAEWRDHARRSEALYDAVTAAIVAAANSAAPEG